MNDERLITDDAHRARYLETLAEALTRTDATLLAWCVMSSHVHLVVQAGDEPLSRLIKPVNTGFAGWLNRRLGRSGPVFGDRYRSILVEREPYLLELVRYVHNNPVRAGVVDDAAMSTWTSHRAYVGAEDVPEWLDVGLVLGQFGRGRSRAGVQAAIKKFDAFVSAGRDEERRGDLSGDGTLRSARKLARVAGDSRRPSDIIVGTEAFVKTVMEQMAGGAATVVPATLSEPIELMRSRPSLDELIVAICDELGIEAWEFTQRPKAHGPAKARRLLTWMWVRWCRGRQVDVATYLKTPSSVVSRWYGAAVAAAPEFDEVGSRVIERIKSSQQHTAKASRKVRSSGKKAAKGKRAKGKAEKRTTWYAIAVADEPDVDQG